MTDERVVAVAGELVMDLVLVTREGLFQAAPGGSPGNVAVGLARLGVPVRMVARIGPDLLGRRLRDHLAGNGVDLSATVAAVEPTSLAIVAVDDSGGPEYDFRVQGTADWQWRDDEVVGVLDGVAALHAGSLALVVPPGADVLSRLMSRARATATVSYDPNCRPALMGSREQVRDRVEQLVALSDVVKASVEDIDWLYPGSSPQEVAQTWLTAGPAIVAVTLGAAGAVAVGPQAGVVSRSGQQVSVVDTVGAGDAFTGGLLAGLHGHGLLGADRRAKLREIPTAVLAEVIDEAVWTSAITCSRRGADPPTAAELAASIRESG